MYSCVIFVHLIFVVIDSFTTAPGWPNQSLGPDGTAERKDTPLLSCGRIVEQKERMIATPTTDQGMVITIVYNYYDH